MAKCRIETFWARRRTNLAEGNTKLSQISVKGIGSAAKYAVSLVVVTQDSERIRLGKGGCRPMRQFYF
jgi:hypothetical protein